MHLYWIIFYSYMAVNTAVIVTQTTKVVKIFEVKKKVKKAVTGRNMPNLSQSVIIS